MNKYGFISQDLQELGYSLSESMGLNETAWSKSESLDIINSIKDEKIAILGGDVYRKVPNGDIESAYCNWSCEPNNGEVTKAYILRSKKVAKEELSKYKDESLIFVMVYSTNVF